MGYIITVAMHKGGVGKTTTVVNVASACAGFYGLRTLVLDLDWQRNATSYFLGRRRDEVPHIAALLRGRVMLEHAAIPTAYADHLHVIAGSDALEAWESDNEGEGRALAGEMLRDLLERARRAYDIIFIDTPPSRGVAVQAALTAADGYLCVAHCSYLSASQIPKVWETATRMRDANPQLRPFGLIANEFQRAEGDALTYLTAYRNLVKEHMLEPPVPRRQIIKESPALGTPVEFLRPHTTASREAARIYRVIAGGLLLKNRLLPDDRLALVRALRQQEVAKLRMELPADEEQLVLPEEETAV